jgi:hypothetical protein
MIKFFRKTRQHLLTENKFGKYLIYAIGEIVLVVIGILIALQINTWNENQKKDEQSAIYLFDLRNDIAFDIETLEERISNNTNRINKADSIIYTLATKKDFSKEELLGFFNQNMVLTNQSYFIPEKSTINQIEASSSGHLIKNKKLRDLIFRYYSINDRTEKNNEISTQLYQHNYFTEHIIKGALLGGEFFEELIGTTLNRPYTDLNKLTQNSDYLAALFGKKFNTESQNKQYEKIKTMAENILELITDELQKSARN